METVHGTKYEAFSSLIIGRCARGSLSIFNAPQGARVERIGYARSSVFSVHTPFTTSLTCAKEGGKLQDFELIAARVEFVGALLEDISTFLDSTRYLVKVNRLDSDSPSWEGAIGSLAANPPKCLVRGCDNLTMQIDCGASPLPIQSPFLLRVVFSGLLLAT